MGIGNRYTSVRLAEGPANDLLWSLQRIRKKLVNNEQPLELSCVRVELRDPETGL